LTDNLDKEKHRFQESLIQLSNVREEFDILTKQNKLVIQEREQTLTKMQL
jgi:hypothetical protein